MKPVITAQQTTLPSSTSLEILQTLKKQIELDCQLLIKYSPKAGRVNDDLFLKEHFAKNQQFIASVNQMSQAAKTPESKLELSCCLLRLADYQSNIARYFVEANPAKAVDLYKQSIEVLQRISVLEQGTEDQDVRYQWVLHYKMQNLVSAWSSLSTCLSQQSSYEKAVAAQKQAIELLKQVPKSSQDAVYKQLSRASILNLVVALSKLACHHSDIEKAISLYKQALEILRQISLGEQTAEEKAESKQMLHDCLLSFANAQIKLAQEYFRPSDLKNTDLEKAIVLHKQAIEALQQISPEGQTEEDRQILHSNLFNLSVLLVHLAGILYTESDLEKTILYYKQARDVLQQIPEFSRAKIDKGAFHRCLSKLARAQSELADRLCDQSDFERAVVYYRQAIESLELIPSSSRDEKCKLMLSSCTRHLLESQLRLKSSDASLLNTIAESGFKVVSLEKMMQNPNLDSEEIAMLKNLQIINNSQKSKPIEAQKTKQASDNSQKPKRRTHAPVRRKQKPVADKPEKEVTKDSSKELLLSIKQLQITRPLDETEISMLTTTLERSLKIKAMCNGELLKEPTDIKIATSSPAEQCFQEIIATVEKMSQLIELFNHQSSKYREDYNAVLTKFEGKQHEIVNSPNMSLEELARIKEELIELNKQIAQLNDSYRCSQSENKKSMDTLFRHITTLHDNFKEQIAKDAQVKAAEAIAQKRKQEEQSKIWQEELVKRMHRAAWQEQKKHQHEQQPKKISPTIAKKSLKNNGESHKLKSQYKFRDLDLAHIAADVSTIVKNMVQVLDSDELDVVKILYCRYSLLRLCEMLKTNKAILHVANNLRNYILYHAANEIGNINTVQFWINITSNMNLTVLSNYTTMTCKDFDKLIPQRHIFQEAYDSWNKFYQSRENCLQEIQWSLQHICEINERVNIKDKSCSTASTTTATTTLSNEASDELYSPVQIEALLMAMIEIGARLKDLCMIANKEKSSPESKLAQETLNTLMRNNQELQPFFRKCAELKVIFAHEDREKGLTEQQRTILVDDVISWSIMAKDVLLKFNQIYYPQMAFPQPMITNSRAISWNNSRPSRDQSAVAVLSKPNTK